MVSVPRTPTSSVPALVGTEAYSDLPGFPYTQVEAASAVEAPDICKSHLTTSVTQVAIYVGTALLEKYL